MKRLIPSNWIKVIGVFPEGTSYTEPAIAQILSGAAWAALEFMRSQHADGEARSVMIIPVRISFSRSACLSKKREGGNSIYQQVQVQEPSEHSLSGPILPTHKSQVHVECVISIV